MRVAILANDAVPGMGLPCSGQGLRVAASAAHLSALGVEPLVLLPRPVLEQRLERWGAVARPDYPDHVRVCDGGEAARLARGCDALLLHNWAAEKALDGRPLDVPVIYDFFSATLVEHAHFGRGPGYLKRLERTKLRAVRRAAHFWANGPGRVAHGAAFLARHELEGEVLDAPFAPTPLERPAAAPDAPPLVAVGGFAQPWAKPAGPALLHALARALPDHEVVALGGGEAFHVAGAAAPGAGHGDAPPNLRAVGPMIHRDHERLIARAAAFVDVAPHNDERAVSFSTRGVAAVAAGCPVVHNAGTDLGRLIERHGAGATVDAGGDIEPEAVIEATRLCLSRDRGGACRSLLDELHGRMRAAARATIDAVRPGGSG